jgi:hypothetical protein
LASEAEIRRFMSTIEEVLTIMHTLIEKKYDKEITGIAGKIKRR